MSKPCIIYENIANRKKLLGEGSVSIDTQEITLAIANTSIRFPLDHIQEFDDVESYQSQDPFLDVWFSFLIVFKESNAERKIYIELTHWKEDDMEAFEEFIKPLESYRNKITTESLYNSYPVSFGYFEHRVLFRFPFSIGFLTWLIPLFFIILTDEIEFFSAHETLYTWITILIFVLSPVLPLIITKLIKGRSRMKISAQGLQLSNRFKTINISWDSIKMLTRYIMKDYRHDKPMYEIVYQEKSDTRSLWFMPRLKVREQILTVFMQKLKPEMQKSSEGQSFFRRIVKPWKKMDEYDRSP